jgi:hypothetical protein
MKITFGACLLLVVATLANGIQASSEWVKHTSVEGRYSVLFPQQPNLNTQEGAAATGEKISLHRAQVADNNGRWSVNYFDLLPEMTFSLVDSRDGAVASVKGTLLFSKAISLEGYPGIEFKIAVKMADVEMLVSSKTYHVGGRVYMLQHLFLKSSDSPAMAKKTAKFFDSFRVAASK